MLRGTVLRLVLLLCLALVTMAHVVAGVHGREEGVGLRVELHVFDDRDTSVLIPVLTEGGPPEPPIDWNRVGSAEPDGDSWVLRMRISPDDSRRLVTVRIVGEVDPSGVPVSEPASFTCGAESVSSETSCTASGDGRYTARWPRSLGARVAISSDLAVGSEIRYTTWAIELSRPEEVAG